MKKEFLVTIKAIVSVNDVAELERLVIAKLDNSDNIVGSDETFDVVDYTDDWLSYEETDKNILNKFHKGQLIIFEGLPCMIFEIDYDDVSIKLYNGDMDDNGFWIDIEGIKKIK